MIQVVGMILLFLSSAAFAVDSDNDGIFDDADPCPLLDGRYYSESSGANPDITRFEFCTRIVAAGPVLEFFIEVSDSFSETLTVSILYWYVNNKQTWISFSREDASLPFRASIELHPNAASGTYAVRSLRITDNEQLDLALNEGQLNDLGFQTEAVLANSDADSTAPVLTSFSTDGWTFDTDGNPQLEATIAVLETGSGVVNSRAILELLSPTGASLQTDANFDESNAANFTLTLSKYSASGIYRVNTVRFADFAGNNQFSKAWLAENPQTFELENALGDQDAPELLSFKLSASFDNASNRPVIRVNGIAFDDVSTVESVYLRLNRPGGGNLDKWITERQAAETLEFSNQIPLTTEFQAGTYEVGFLRLNDVAENQIHFYKSDLEALGSEVSAEINVYFPDHDEVSQGASLVVASDKSDFVFGANLSDDVIEAGNGNDEIYTGSGDDTVDAGAGDDIIIGGSGEGDDYYNGGSGIDQVVYSSASKGVTVDLNSGSATGEEIGTDTLASIEGVVGGAGNDVIKLNSSDNLIFGEGGDDTIYNLDMEGDDFAFGGDGADRFYWSGSGVFTMSGGGGADTFYPQQLTPSGAVVISDFDVAEGDSIDLSDLLPGLGQAWIDLQNKQVMMTEVVELQGGAGSYVLALTSAYQIEGQQSHIATINTAGALNNVSEIFDSDGDGVLNVADAFPLDATESIDTDLDGTGNNADSDDDNDSVLDGADAFPLDATETSDTDSDGVGDNADAFPSDAEESIDTDGDQVGDNADNCPNLSNANQLNTDGDTEGDVCDLDDDNDGFSDQEELVAATDPLGASSCPGCFNWDIDDDGEAIALTDGLMMIRHMFGFGGDSLSAGAMGAEAGRATPEAISSHLTGANAELDVDGDGESKALTDGLLLIRYLFGFSGDSLISGAIGNGAERDTAEEVEAYIEARLPPSP